MTKINLEKYFENTEIKHYDSKILITILEDILGKDIDTVKIELDELRIVVSAEQIVEYLNNKFEDEEPEVKARLENPKPSKPLSDKIEFNKILIEDIEESKQGFADRLTAARYGFDSYTLNYFNKYSNIVRNKAKKILGIIEKIANKDYSTIADLIIEYDIQLDENGNISKEDIIRLIPPFVHNYNSLVEKVNAANNLETYLTFKLSKHSLYRGGWSEGELYPTSSIQSKSLYYDDMKGNIPLSRNQRKTLQEEQSKANKKFIKSLLDW
mgnify:CR=1 FL=1